MAEWSKALDSNEWSQALDSGSSEPGLIPVSALLVGFYRTAHEEKHTQGQ